MIRLAGGALAVVFVLAAGAACAPAGEPEGTGLSPHPNILWILAEDMGPDLSVYGTPEVHTPNLDALAQGGMRFNRAFSTSPVCSTSRSAFHTGMYQMTIGAHNHRSHRPDDESVYPFPLPDGVRLITDWLRPAGYFTGNIVHFPQDIAFEGTGKTDWNFTVEGEPFDTDRWDELKQHQPFFAQINFPETHRGEAWDTAHLHLARRADPARVAIPPYYPDHPVIREDWAQYLNSAMALDAKVGEVMRLLERDGLAENTIVVFMGDHGRAMVRAKQWPYDSGLHVPLIVHWPDGLETPRGYAAGSVSEQLVSSLDVTATTLALAGVGKPARMQGRVLLGEGAEEPRRYLFAGRDRGDETVDRIRTVRDARFRYIRNYYPDRPFLQTNRYKEARYPAIRVMRELHRQGRLTPAQARLMAPTRPAEELYDLEADPYEVENLAGSPEHQQVLEELRARLDEWIEESGDLGAVPEDSAVLRYYEARAKRLWDAEIAALRGE